jgi:hypothetical protein
MRCAPPGPAEMKQRAALLAVLALAAPGCATTDEDLHRELLAERLETLTIVTRAELARQPEGSPSRTILALWRAVQYRNPQAALARVAPQPTPEQLKRFESSIVATGAQAASTTKPRILDSKVSGKRATVLIEFIRHRKIGDQVRSVVAGRLPVKLVHTKAGWLVLWRKAADDLPEAMT